MTVLNRRTTWDHHVEEGVGEVPEWEIVLFIVAALVTGGLTMGGMTLVYFLDEWRDDPQERSFAASNESRRARPFDQAA
jgi:hypothetical protein